MVESQINAVCCVGTLVLELNDKFQLANPSSLFTGIFLSPLVALS